MASAAANCLAVSISLPRSLPPLTRPPTEPCPGLPMQVENTFLRSSGLARVSPLDATPDPAEIPRTSPFRPSS